MSRRQRSVRPPARRYEVTPRDREIVHAVARMSLATTDQIVRLFFSDQSTASRRLAKLVALRLLDVKVCGQTDPNIYTVGAKGRALLEEDEVDALEIHRGKVGRHLDLHLRALNDFRVELVRGARDRPDVRLELFRSDLDLRRLAGASVPPYIPDALVELEVDSGRLALFVEIDTGTEGRSVFASKARWTAEAWRSGSRVWGIAPGAWRPVVFVPTPGRARALSLAICEHDAGDLWLVAETGRLVEVGAFGPLFATATDVARTPRRSAITYHAGLAGRPHRMPQ
ncbi:MAG: replication-relaxation family protein [Polyangiaceae bacterium]